MLLDERFRLSPTNLQQSSWLKGDMSLSTLFAIKQNSEAQ